jgi:hypothetical protein
VRRALKALSAAAGWVLTALRDRGFVVFIISLLTSLYALGLIVPQRGTVRFDQWQAWREQSPRLVWLLERTGLVDVYRAPGTYVALGFFFVSLTAVVADRFPRLVRRTRVDQGLALDPSVLAGRKGTLALPAGDPADGVRLAVVLLRAAGYRIHAAGAGAARAVRFRIAPLGFVLFHGAFALLLAGGLLLDLTRFAGIANVGEGEVFDARTGEYDGRPRAPRAGRDRPELSFTVVGVRPRSERGFPLSLHVDLLLVGASSLRTANVNEPVNEGTTSVLALSAGAMPLFACEAAGATDGAWVKLVPNPTGRSRFVLEPCGLDVLARPHEPEARAAPRPEGQGVMLGTVGVARLENLALTGVEVAVRGPDGAVARGVLRPGESIATPGGERVLHMPELRYYAKLQIVDERGGGLLWAGFVLGTLGLILRLVLFRREVAVVADPANGRLLVATAADVAGWRPDALLARLEAAIGASGAAAPPRRGP